MIFGFYPMTGGITLVTDLYSVELTLGGGGTPIPTAIAPAFNTNRVSSTPNTTVVAPRFSTNRVVGRRGTSIIETKS